MSLLKWHFIIPLPLCHTSSFFCPNYGLTDGFLCTFGWLCKSDYEKGGRKDQKSQFLLLVTLIFTDKHVLTSDTSKKEKTLPPELVSKQDSKHFKTVIFNLFCTDNRSDDSLVGLFLLLLIVKSSEPHHIHGKKKLNYWRNERRKNFSECYHLFCYTSYSQVTFCHLFNWFLSTFSYVAFFLKTCDLHSFS